jgi:hypothetical protein
MKFEYPQSYTTCKQELKLNLVWPVWKMDLFGKGELVVHINTDVPWSRRVVSKLLLGTKWTKIKK